MDGTNRIDELEQKFIENPRRYFAPLANEYRKAGNPHQAIAICRAHLSQLPGHMSGQIVYGQALYEGGEYDQAQTVFENALAMDRENLVALRHLGDLALRKGETAAARQWYSKILEIDPKDPAVIALVGEIDAAAEAQTSTTDAEPASTTTPEAVQPMPDPAADDARRREEDDLLAEELGYPVPPAHAFVTETMAELYLAQGFRDRALSVYRQLVEIRPEDERLRSRLAQVEQADTAANVTEARANEPPSVETPEPSGDEESEPSVETPAPPREVDTPSEESGVGDTTPVDSPPAEAPEHGQSTQIDSPPGDASESEESAPVGSAPSADETAFIEAVSSYASEAATTESPSSEPAGDVDDASSSGAFVSAESSLPDGAVESEAVAAAPHHGVSVREFFAALGRQKPLPRSNGAASNGTGHAPPQWSSSGESAGDPDAKAAATLAGAFGTQQGASAFGQTPASPATGKESEEDVARFRAWLDGLTT